MGSFLSTVKCNIVNMNNVVETNNIQPNNVTSPSDEEFVNYLSSLWSSDIDNVRTFNDLPSHNEINEDDLKIEELAQGLETILRSIPSYIDIMLE